jgi:hypothetical protein
MGEGGGVEITLTFGITSQNEKENFSDAKIIDYHLKP